ncbi:MAG: MoaD/ThiS family protein [Candidatus Kariarchaeaceae archaeon]
MLRSYTNNQKYVNVNGKTLAEALDNLNSMYEGIRFRFIDETGEVRQHMRVYVNGIIVEDLKMEVNDHDEIFITQSLSGGILDSF